MQAVAIAGQHVTMEDIILQYAELEQPTWTEKAQWHNNVIIQAYSENSTTLQDYLFHCQSTSDGEVLVSSTTTDTRVDLLAWIKSLSSSRTPP